MISTFCSYFDKRLCRSCEWIERDYPSQLVAKEMKVREALSFFPARCLEKAFANTIGSAPRGFRNRAKMTVTGTQASPVIGLIGEARLDEGRELLSCPIHHPKINELIVELPALIRDHGLVPYRIDTRSGELKGLILFYSPLTEQMYLRFILRSKESLPRIRELLPVLEKRFPTLVCVSANIQPVPHAILEGPEELILTANGFIDHQIGPLRLKLSPQAFVQTNFGIATRLYQTAADWIAEAHPGRVLDLFCGQGAFSFFAARSAGRILGVELNAEAVKTASETAKELGLGHVTFKCADATALAAEIEEFRPDLVLANPPRRGLAEGIELIRRQKPMHFIYSSCALESLAADLKKLSEEYRLRRVQIFDMFPHTRHFETLVWLERSDVHLDR